MNHALLISALIATLSLAACDRPTIVSMSAAPVAVPGPAGPQGATGDQGETGKPGEGTTVIVVPAEAAAPAN